MAAAAAAAAAAVQERTRWERSRAAAAAQGRQGRSGHGRRPDGVIPVQIVLAGDGPVRLEGDGQG